jgi:hypothetical protein
VYVRPPMGPDPPRSDYALLALRYAKAGALMNPSPAPVYERIVIYHQHFSFIRTSLLVLVILLFLVGVAAIITRRLVRKEQP